MRRKLIHPELWTSKKYITWPPSLNNPVVRVPHPSGEFESHTIPFHNSEPATFARCLTMRDHRGMAIWGKARWDELVRVPKRSVVKHRRKPAGPIPGVNHADRPGRAPVWTALWYERQPDGTTSRRSVQYSYGTPHARFTTSEQAMAAAIEKRLVMAACWYSTGAETTPRQSTA